MTTTDTNFIAKGSADIGFQTTQTVNTGVYDVSTGVLAGGSEIGVLAESTNGTGVLGRSPNGPPP